MKQPRAAATTEQADTPVVGAADGHAVVRTEQPVTSLAQALRRPRYEVLPLVGTAEQVTEHVPLDLPVTVTASPRRGLEPTIALAETLAELGYDAVPHLAARLLRDEGHLSEVLQRLDAAGVSDVFVVSGDSPHPTGTFPDSLTLLAAIVRLRPPGTGGLPRLGVTGYPEGHPLVADAELTRALLAKQPVAAYVVSQMCFDPTAVSGWLGRVRPQGMALPLYVGVAGVVERRKLLRIAGRIGIGPSTRFLSKHRYALLRALRPGYRPDRFLRGLATEPAQPSLGIAGLHVYTLGDVAATEKWRCRALARLAEDHGRG